jgi:hypothetical protein
MYFHISVGITSTQCNMCFLQSKDVQLSSKENKQDECEHMYLNKWQYILEFPPITFGHRHLGH